MHSVQKRDTARSSVEQRLSSFANETWTSPPTIQCDDTYQGDLIRGAARKDRNAENNGSNEIDADVEKGIWKTVSLEVQRDAKKQG